MNDITIAGQTDVGQRRKDNQDTFISTPIWGDASALLVVIDGVGGYAGGDRAAAIARESIERYMATPNGDPLSMLREAVVFANNQINEQRGQDPKLAQMCCVLTAVVADARMGRLHFVHVGDTRLYRYRQNALEKLTADHSLVGVREDANQLTEAEAMQHPRRNEILREVGSAAHRVDDPDFLDSGETDFGPGDVLLLCSDGLTDMITQAQIVGVLNRKLPLKEQVSGLIKLANSQGGNDNITVVLGQNTTQSTQQSLPATAQPGGGRTQKLPLPPAPATASGGVAAGTPHPTRRSLVRLVALVVLLAGIGAGVWYPFGQSDNAVRATDSLTTTRRADSVTAPPVSRSIRLDSLLQTAYRSANHRLVLPNDTIRLTQPLQLTDSLQSIVGGNRTVLIPADTTRVALRAVGRDTVNLENLVISGFKTGIETTGPVRLRLKAVYFKNVDLPVSAVVRQDTFRDAVMTISVQNQPVPPKPARN